MQVEIFKCPRRLSYIARGKIVIRRRSRPAAASIASQFTPRVEIVTNEFYSRLLRATERRAAYVTLRNQSPSPPSPAYIPSSRM